MGGKKNKDNFRGKNQRISKALSQEFIMNFWNQVIKEATSTIHSFLCCMSKVMIDKSIHTENKSKRK